MLRTTLRSVRQFFSYSPKQLFEQRKLLYQYTSQKLGEATFANSQHERIRSAQPLSVYCGYDPTAESLHLGNLVSIIMMARLQNLLHLRPIFLLGGATGLIGDPSGKKQQRTLLQQSRVHHNLKSIQTQIKEVYRKISQDLAFNKKQYGFKEEKSQIVAEPLFINNIDFYKNMNVLTFLRDIGKVLRMSSMLTKQTVANRLQSQNGLSYTEFSYSILQSYDFYMLSQNYGCILQFGGSDQWGNITNGCDLIRKLSKNKTEAHGITMPLLLTKTGEKFGKSQGNALYLNRNKTPTSAIYDYLYSTPDSQIQKLLYIFTFYSPERIKQILTQHQLEPEKRVAQKILASKLTDWLGVYKNVKEQLIRLNNQGLKSKNELEWKQIYAQLSSQMKRTLKLSEVGDKIKNLPDLLVELSLCKSRNEARRDIEGEGVYLNGTKTPKQYSEQPLIQVLNENKMNGNFFLVKKGKKKFVLLKIE